MGSNTKPIDGFLACLIQYPVPVVNSRADVELQVETICKTGANTKAGYPGMELMVFPEHAVQGLNTHIWFADRITDPVPGPATDAFCEACAQNETYGVFHIVETNPDADQNPSSTAIVCDPNGKIILKYRKVQPWVPIEPWHPGDLGVPVCDGPAGSKLSVCIGHDGMFPEIVREAAYNGANVLIRVSGYNTIVEEQWNLTNRSNAWHNLMYTLSVNLAGYDGVFYYIGQAMAGSFDGTVIVQGQRDPWEIVSAEVYPGLVDNARLTLGGREQHLQPGSEGLRRRAGRGQRQPLQLGKRPVGGQVSPALGGQSHRQRRRDVRVSQDRRALQEGHFAALPRGAPSDQMVKLQPS